MAKRRRFGCIFTRGDRFRIAFTLEKKRHKRTGGKTRAQAEKRLAYIEALCDKGKTAQEILHEVFGDAPPGGDIFQKIAEEYKARPDQDDRDEETTAKEHRRIEAVCKAPWASRPVGSITRASIRKWYHRRAEQTSGPTANRDLSIASVIFDSAIEAEIIGVWLLLIDPEVSCDARVTTMRG